uniref:Uncharacterized protein n=1 Tax=Arundo donax TaxID=35708 RepID=A0A0A9GJJ1_ARUDO
MRALARCGQICTKLLIQQGKYRKLHIHLPSSPFRFFSLVTIFLPWYTFHQSAHESHSLTAFILLLLASTLHHPYSRSTRYILYLQAHKQLPKARRSPSPSTLHARP